MNLSVLVALHNESANIGPFYERAKPVLESLSGLSSWQIIFINDGSDDDSLDQILKLRAKDSRVKVISLSRNFGYQSALTAGFTLADSDLYAVLDVDCEDPPELLTQFYENIQKGVHLTYGIRSNRDEPAIITKGRALFYHINNRIADSPTILWMAEFGMMTRKVRDAILMPRTTFPFLRSEMAYVGFARAGVDYRREKRAHGKSHYNLLSMTRFAVAGFLAGSTFPLRFVLYLSAVLALAYPLMVLLFGLDAAGAAQLASVLTFYMALTTFPILALYLARTYRNVVSRPVFIVDEGRSQLS